MKILYLITKSEIGGAQVHALDLMKYMVKEGHSVALMSYPGGWLVDEAKRIGVEFYPNINFSNSFNPLNALKAIVAVRKAVESFSPDLVSAHSSGAGFLGRLAIRKKIPTLFTAHSWAFTEGAPFFRKRIAIMAEKFAAQYTSKIICVSEYDKRLALHYSIAPVSKLVMIHNGVEIKEATFFDNKDSTIKILSMGRLAYPKSFQKLIGAIFLISKKSKKNIRLNIIGAGPLLQDIQDLIINLKLEDTVFLLGEKTKEEVFGEMRSSDIFALISKHEGLPITILEAMAAGLPVVASKVGGIPEEIDASCGLLVKSNTPQEIAEKLMFLIEDEEKRESLGRSAHERAKKLFSVEKFLEETKEVYKNLLND